MSAEGVAAISVGAALGGVAVTQLANLLLEKRRDREWYRRTLYEKRLQAVADAHSWIMRIHHASSADESVIRSQARDWYNANALFFYDSLPRASEFIGLVNTQKTHADYERQLSHALEEIRTRVEDLRP